MFCVYGIRLEGINGGTIENIEIYNLNSHTELGNEICGQYSQNNYDSTGTFRYTYPMQKGFSGNHVQGISLCSSENIIFKDINIHDLNSKNGLTYGLALWPNNQVQLQGSFNMYKKKKKKKIIQFALLHTPHK